MQYHFPRVRVIQQPSFSKIIPNRVFERVLIFFRYFRYNCDVISVILSSKDDSGSYLSVGEYTPSVHRVRLHQASSNLASVSGWSLPSTRYFLFFVVTRFIKSNIPAVKYQNSSWPGLENRFP